MSLESLEYIRQRNDQFAREAHDAARFHPPLVPLDVDAGGRIGVCYICSCVRFIPAMTACCTDCATWGKEEE